MNVFSTFHLSFRSFARNKIRTSLTMLGIIIGVSNVVTILAIGTGAARLVEERVRSLGSNMLMIYPGAVSQGGVSMGGGTQVTLTPQDAEAIQHEIEGVKAVSPVVQTRGQIVYGDRNWLPRSIRGEGEDYLEVKDWGILEGEFFNVEDVQAYRKVCVIGMTLMENLFPDESPVGRVIRIQGRPFRILGVLDRKGTSAGGEDQDDVVILPWTTVKKVLQGSSFNNVDLLLVSSREEAQMAKVGNEVEALLRDRHHIPDDHTGDFNILSTVEIIETSTRNAKVMTTFLAIVASISLLVGGVGIMNIMLISIAERTREIGLRMAVGARRSDILFQFLTEATLLALGAGALGVLFGAGAIELLGGVLHWPTYLSWPAAALSLVSSSSVGIFFGFYPAWKACRLDPIAALRAD
ncbi:MAG TPA: ABC transporter permease [Planctomycetota bacterium]|nr:ABC transporter permease [Planctomycetota bacterium]